MSRPSLSWPLSVLAGFAVFALFLLAGTIDELPAIAQGNSCQEGNPAYPACVQQTNIAFQTNQALGDAEQTATASAEAAQARTALAERCQSEPAYPLCVTPSATSGSEGGGGNNSGGQQQQPQVTSTFTPTATRTIPPTPTGSSGRQAPGTPTTAAATPTGAPAAAEPSPTSAAALPEGVTALACVPGETVDLAGQTEPNSALLLFFDERPVGGGLSGADGRYRLRLQVGDERPGTYLVEVRERVGRALVEQFGCEVPPFTPTPTIGP